MYQKNVWKDNDIILAEKLNRMEDGIEAAEARSGTHEENKENPHAVTKRQLGLGNVDNVKQASKLEFDGHCSDKMNPHQVNKAQVGLSNVSNVQQAAKTEFDEHCNNISNPHVVTKAQVGLGNVDNTSDVNKPISTAVQTALNNKAASSHTHTMAQISDSPNIRKNSASTTGDIINTHLTVGSRKSGKAYGDNSATFGYGNVASGSYSKAAGLFSEATGFYASAEGSTAVASGDVSHAEGNHTEASGGRSHAEGNQSLASGNTSHAEGNITYAYADYSHTGGIRTVSQTYCQCIYGQYNKLSTTSLTNYNSSGDAFIIGNGTSDSVRSNAFRVTFNGNAYGLATFHSTGADYAEYFEWADGNPDDEDRVGRFVAIDGEKIHVAGKNDTNILGIVSANPAVLGNAHEDTYHGMYLTDEWGRVQYEHVDVPAEYEERVVGVDKNGNEITERMEVHPARRDYVPKLNPDYNPDEEYIPRSERNEWDAVGMMGQLLVRDDGTCVPGGFCTCADGGIATASETGYYVMSRLSDNIIKILFR